MIENNQIIVNMKDWGGDLKNKIDLYGDIFLWNNFETSIIP